MLHMTLYTRDNTKLKRFRQVKKCKAYRRAKALVFLARFFKTIKTADYIFGRDDMMTEASG